MYDNPCSINPQLPVIHITLTTYRPASIVSWLTWQMFYDADLPCGDPPAIILEAKNKTREQAGALFAKESVRVCTEHIGAA